MSRRPPPGDAAPMPSTAQRALLIGAPLAFAALLMLHPTGGDDFAVLVSENLTAWLAVHYGAAVLFPLMGYLLWVLIRDLPGRAATVARYAIPVYAVVYGVYEAMVGLATGIVTQEGGDRRGASPRPSTASRRTRSSARADCCRPSAASPGSSPSRAPSSPCAPPASARARSCCSASAR